MKTVLIVQRSPVIRRMLASALNRRGYRVVQASGGWSALEQLRTHPVGLVLAEEEVPGLSGMELVMRIRSGEVKADVPVLVMTEGDSPAAALGSAALGATAHLAKPFTPSCLAAAVAAVLGTPVATPVLEAELSAA